MSLMKLYEAATRLYSYATLPPEFTCDRCGNKYCVIRRVGEKMPARCNYCQENATAMTFTELSALSPYSIREVTAKDAEKVRWRAADMFRDACHSPVGANDSMRVYVVALLSGGVAYVDYDAVAI